VDVMCYSENNVCVKLSSAARDAPSKSYRVEDAPPQPNGESSANLVVE
jgi:hypothetical protein